MEEQVELVMVGIKDNEEDAKANSVTAFSSLTLLALLYTRMSTYLSERSTVVIIIFVGMVLPHPRRL
jgi:hypothetical protein